MAVATRFNIFLGLFTVIELKFTIEEQSRSAVYCVELDALPEVLSTVIGLQNHEVKEESRLPSSKPTRQARVSAQEHRQCHGHGRPATKPHPKLLANKSHANSSHVKDLDHTYYISRIYGPTDTKSRDWCVNIEQMDKRKVHGVLPNTHRQAMTVNLSFEFPYYGHLLKEITVTTGGFLYTGDVLHEMLTETQYIAPLMANFDPSISPNSTIIYSDNGTALVVQWDHIYLQEASHLGSFTFQVTLHSDGRITFAYKEIPTDISLIISDHHPVKVGLSDAFVVLHNIQQIPDIRRKTIYEYHRVELLTSKITTCTVVELLPLPTCLQFTSCDSCVTAHISFSCKWCKLIQRCSSGFDRNRQDWVDSGCQEEMKNQSCSAEFHNVSSTSANNNTVETTNKTVVSTGTALPSKNDSTVSSSYTLNTTTSTEQIDMPEEPSDDRLQTGPLVGIICLVLLMVVAVLTTIYIYHHPTSSASLFFIERRPAHWPTMKFRRGSGHPAYADVDAMGQDRESFIVMEFKESFSVSDRRESSMTTDQRDGFIVPDQKECFLKC